MGTQTRRQFLATSASAAAGLIIGCHVPWRRASAQEGSGRLPAPNAFLRIAEDESVTMLLAHSEMGQGIWTTLPMLIAEELGCDWSKVRVEHAPAAPEYVHTAYGIQMTGGSTTTWSEFDRYRQVGALARTMLLSAAAQRLKVTPDKCRVDNGYVVCGTERLSFGSLAVEAAKQKTPTSVDLKPRESWKVIGHAVRRLDSPEKVTGQAQFGMDIQIPGLKTAVVARSPVFGGKVKSFRPEEAMKVPGVRAVVQVPTGVAVVADHFWAARLGRDALHVEWDPGPGASLSTERLREEYRRLAATRGLKAEADGDVEGALKSAAKVLEADYEVPYLAHAAMEPLNCTVKIGEDGCDVWTGTQFQTAEQATAAGILGLKPPQVRIHTPFLGGGFGRRAVTNCEFVAEAVHAAKATGMPVKVVWTREDDMRRGYYRPMWLDRMRAGLDASGMPTAWQQTIVGQSILEGTPFSGMVVNGIDGTSVEGAADSPYVKGIANRLVELHSPKSEVTVLWWRSVGHSHTAFAVECFVDEMAHAAGMDPVAYRIKLLQGSRRHLGALDLAAAKFKWGAPLAAGRAKGIAVHESFGSFVALAVEVSVEEERIRVHRAVAAIDCGTCVNPAGVAAQIESGVVFGLSATLHGEITIRDGRAEQSNFHDYPVLRIAEMPKVETYIVRSTEKPGGVGEPGVPPVAPAVANAVFAATGKRLRRLPLRLAGE
jgi:isoquinoline 1-oxidoreductase beta subunit